MLDQSTSSGVSAAETEARIDLAAAIRLVSLFGWDDVTLAHLSARSPDNPDHMLLHGPQYFFDEVQASNLHLLDRNAEHVRPQDDMPHKFAFPFHREIYDAFPKANAIIHVHTKAVCAVAMQKQGLIPGNQYAMWLGPIGYHDYPGMLSSPEIGADLVNSFGDGQIVLQRGHGVVIWAPTQREAFVLAYTFNRACEAQIMSGVGGGGIEAYVPPNDVLGATVQQARAITDGEQMWSKVCWEGWKRKIARSAPDYCH